MGRPRVRVRIGTRGSDLALWQAQQVGERLRAAGCETEIVVLKTRGDRIDDVPLHRVEGKGFFTAEIEQALLEGRVDLAVHSHKDLPCAATEGLVIAAVPARASPRERLLVAPAAHDPQALFLPLREGARVGTSAPRRTEQVRALRPDLEHLALRGNVPTRVQRLRDGLCDAILLASAGLDRLGLDLEGLIDLPLPASLLVPAPAQGALALEIRARDRELFECLRRELADPATERAVAAERALLQELGGGCNLPLGVLVEATGASGAQVYRALAFLGADHPAPGASARWCQALGASEQAAARAAGRILAAAHATGVGPLGGLRVALIGSAGSGEALAARLTVLGATVVRETALEIEDLDGSELPGRLAGLRPGDALAVTSANAARRLAGSQVPPGVLVAAVGAATARALEAAGVRARIVGAAGARELARSLSLERGARVLFPCAESARLELEQELAGRGIQVDRLVLYRTRAAHTVELDPAADARVYLSPSAVQASLEWERARAREGASPGARGSPALRLALGSATAARLQEAGLAVTRSQGTTPEDLLRALVRVLGKTRPEVKR